MASKKKETHTVNQKQAADYLGVARATISKAIVNHKIEPVGKDRGVDMYELKDLIPAIVKPKKTVRAGSDTFKSQEIKNINSIISHFGSMKEYQAYQNSLTAEQKRKADAGLLMEAETVIATIGAVISAIRRLSLRIPNVAQELCEDFTHAQAKEFDEKLDSEIRTLLLDANGIIEYANKQLHDAGTGDK